MTGRSYPRRGMFGTRHALSLKQSPVDSESSFKALPAGVYIVVGGEKVYKK